MKEELRALEDALKGRGAPTPPPSVERPKGPPPIPNKILRQLEKAKGSSHQEAEPQQKKVSAPPIPPQHRRAEAPQPPKAAQAPKAPERNGRPSHQHQAPRPPERPNQSPHNERVTDAQYEDFAWRGIEVAENYQEELGRVHQETLERLADFALKAHTEYKVPLNPNVLDAFLNLRKTGFKVDKSDGTLSKGVSRGDVLQEVGYAINRYIVRNPKMHDKQVAEALLSPFTNMARVRIGGKDGEDIPYAQAVAEAEELRNAKLGRQTLEELLRMVPELKGTAPQKWEAFLKELAFGEELDRFLGADVLGLHPEKAEELEKTGRKRLRLPATPAQETYAKEENTRLTLENAKTYGIPLVLRSTINGHANDFPVRVTFSPRAEHMSEDFVPSGKEWLQIQSVFQMSKKKGADGTTQDTASKQNYPGDGVVSKLEIHSPAEIPQAFMDALSDPKNRELSEYCGLDRETLFARLLADAKESSKRWFADNKPTKKAHKVKIDIPKIPGLDE
jgi:hypothetical protein